jgi:hypothetical protein
MDLSNQKQVTGDHSTAIQATNVTVIHQADKEMMADIARSVVQRDMETLANKAFDSFKVRTETLTDTLITKLAENSDFKKEKFEDPRYQFALGDAQREYGKDGSPHLRDELVNLLVRMNVESSDEKSKLYAEAIKVIPQLTRAQVNAIAIKTGVQYLQKPITDQAGFVKYFEGSVFPFLIGAARSQYDFSHIEYARCGQIGLGQQSFKALMAEKYGGLFSLGFDEALIPTHVPKAVRDIYIIKSRNDDAKVQVNALNERGLDEAFRNSHLSQQDLLALKVLYQGSAANLDQVGKKLAEWDTRFSELDDYYANTLIQRLTLTSVGTIIGVVNIENASKMEVDLSRWFT